MIFNDKEKLKDCVHEAADILHRKADEIVADIDNEKVTGISVTMFINPGEVPTIEISKSYSACKVGNKR